MSEKRRLKRETFESYREMEDFISTIRDTHLQEILSVAIQGAGAFRRFKDVLFRYPEQRENWFKYKDRNLEQHILE